MTNVSPPSLDALLECVYSTRWPSMSLQVNLAVSYSFICFSLVPHFPLSSECGFRGCQCQLECFFLNNYPFLLSYNLWTLMLSVFVWGLCLLADCGNGATATMYPISLHLKGLSVSCFFLLYTPIISQIVLHLVRNLLFSIKSTVITVRNGDYFLSLKLTLYLLLPRFQSYNLHQDGSSRASSKGSKGKSHSQTLVDCRKREGIERGRSGPCAAGWGHENHSNSADEEKFKGNTKSESNGINSQVSLANRGLAIASATNTTSTITPKKIY
jgi:hypothetical protein